MRKWLVFRKFVNPAKKIKKYKNKNILKNKNQIFQLYARFAIK